jgi:hypothetical protein
MLYEKVIDVEGFCYTIVVLIKGKAIPVTGRGGPYGCETSKLPHFYRQSAHR